MFSLKKLLGAAGLTLAIVCGIGAGARLAEARQLNIVTTVSDLASIAEEIAGEHARISYIVDGTRDAHFLDARPSFIVMARNADLWIRMGMELEIGWEPVLIDGARNNKIRVGQPGHLDASQNILRLEVPEGPIDRSMGDVHASGNPHYNLDPLNGRIVAKTIADRLIQLDTRNAASYRENLAAFEKAIDIRMFGEALVEQFGGSRLWAEQLRGTLDTFLAENDAAGKLGGWGAAMRPVRNQKVVTYHKTWSYLANRFGFTVVTELEPLPGIPPSARHLANVVKIMEENNVRVILQAPIYPTRAAENVARRTGAKVVVAAHLVGGTPEAKDYLSMIDAAVNALANAFQANTD